MATMFFSLLACIPNDAYYTTRLACLREWDVQWLWDSRVTPQTAFFTSDLPLCTVMES